MLYGSLRSTGMYMCNTQMVMMHHTRGRDVYGVLRATDPGGMASH